MKPTQNDLKAMFGQTPGSFTQAIERGLNAEEAPLRRSFAWRTALITALILLCTAAAAYALGAQLGLFNYWKAEMGITPSPQTQAQLEAGPVKVFDLGPVKITLQESLADGRLVYTACLAETADGSPALFWPPSEDVYISSVSFRESLGLETGVTYTEAAQRLGRPLYRVSAYPSLAPGIAAGEEMMDCQWDEAGRTMMIHMLFTDPQQAAETLPLTLSLQAQEIDPATGNPLADRRWEAEASVILPVGGVIVEKDYLPVGEAQAGGLTLMRLHAAQTCAGVYVDIVFIAPQGRDGDCFDYWGRLSLTDAQGNPLPMGVSFSGSLDEAAAPEWIVKDMMVTLNALPDRLYVTVKDSQGNPLATLPFQ